MRKKSKQIKIDLIILECTKCHRMFGVDKNGGKINCPYCKKHIEG